MEAPYKYFAKYYDHIVKEGWYKSWYKFILEILKKEKFKPELIIDAACGTGKLSKLLSNISSVVGFDKSPEMIKIARTNYKNINFSISSFSNFHLSTKKKADVIICAFDSLNYLSTAAELEKALANFKNNLNNSGYLLFDVNGEKAFAGEKKLITNKRIFLIGKDKVVWNNYFYPRKWKVVFEIYKHRKDGKLRTYKEIHEEYYYSPKNIKKILKRLGFLVKGIYSNSNFCPIKSINKRYFFVAQKISF